MEFRVIFSPHKEESTTIKPTDLFQSMLAEVPENSFTRKERRLPKKGNVGIHILDLYRKKTGDDQVTLKDLPSVIAESWRDDGYFEVAIDEKTARSSGRFLESDTFYCFAEFYVMRKFEDVDIIDDNAEERKLILSIDKGKILSEWIKQKHPAELQLPADSL